MPADETIEQPIEQPREPWWTWRWDRLDARNVDVPYTDITRWRRGSLLTVYRLRTTAGVQWWFYLPFNLCFGVGGPW